MAKEDSSLEKLKRDYKKLQEKHNLPDFEKLNEDFGIEKIAEYETDILVREVRKFIVERFSNYLRLIEELLHPVNSQFFVFSLISAMSQNDKKELAEIYKKIAKNEVESIETDIEFSEKKEVQYIKDSYELWQEIKKELLKIIGNIKNNWDAKSHSGNNGYFG